MQLVNTRLYLSSSRHAAWLLSVLHALLVPQPEGPGETSETVLISDGIGGELSSTLVVLRIVDI